MPSAEIEGWFAQSAIAMIGVPAALVRGGPLLRRWPSQRGSCASWRRRRRAPCARVIEPLRTAPATVRRSAATEARRIDTALRPFIRPMSSGLCSSTRRSRKRSGETPKIDGAWRWIVRWCSEWKWMCCER